MLIADHVKKQGAKSICAVVPYLAYARQDRSFIEKSNAISISAILGMLNFAGISRLITAAPHSAKVIEAFSGMVSVVDAITPLANLLKGEIANPIILAPDKGALGIAEKFANVIGCGYTYLEKERDRITGEVKILKAPDTDFSGRDVIVADDMISTGGTTAQAARFAYANGANKVIAAAVHLLMAGNAYDKIKGAGVDLICGTNTIPCDNARIADISKEIAAAISGQ
jgi:ribose-phosphate pyrophosphokinase